MRSPEKMKWLFLVIALLVFANFGIAQEKDLSDEDSPEVTARVARISFVRGDVQVKRAGEKDWENVSLNLPLVEGDEISTSNNARVEIQFDSQNFLRLAENSFLKITTLRDEGIAVSLNEGILSLRVFDFEKDKGYFEIDAPQTTVSVQSKGLYRIDATDRSEVRVTASEGGQARVYSDSSGFTLRNGRSATIFLSDDRLGEWETADASRYFDEWDRWVAERDNKLGKLLKDSYYGKYYDRDIYGAEDLNDYGSWSYSNDYGWAWRPHQTSISIYNNWSPYRYGHWTWLNPYGWVWVNDEPWGWATYHHGRWVYDNRGWFWTPYSYYRPKRSWWKGALVAIFNVNTDICWYPLSYRDRYYDYNRHYRRNDRDRFYDNRRDDDRNYGSRDYRRLPENSIIGMRSGDFGRRRGEMRSIPRQTLEQNPTGIAQLPRFEGRRREDFRRDADFRRSQQSEQIRTGVTERQAGVELDRRLQNERFRNNRQRDERNRQPETVNNGSQNTTENNDGRRNERFERRNRDSNSETPNQPNRQIILSPNSRQTPNNDNNSERRNQERQRRDQTDEQRPVNIPQNNDSPINNQRSRNRDNNSGENNQPTRIQNNNSNENNQRSRERNDNSDENNRRSRIREKDAENDNPNNIRRDNPPENRPTYSPRNNDENRRSAPPRSEEPQPRPQPRREERREEPRQEPRREEPRQEQPRVEQRREERREERRQEQPRQEQPRPKEQPREERRTPPKSETKREDPIDN